MISLSRQRKRKLALLVMIFFSIAFVVAVIFWVFLPEHSSWVPYDSYNCGECCENSDLCGHRMTSQPINAWTSFAYILAGLWPIVILRVDMTTFAYFLSSMYIGICSFVSHESLSIKWQRLDVASQYTLCLCIVLQGIHAISGFSWNWFFPTLVGMGIPLGFLKRSKHGADFRYPAVMVFFAWILTIVALIVAGTRILDIARAELTTRQKQQRSSRVFVQLTIPAILLAIAISFKKKDMDKTWCSPRSAFQGHAVWHCLTALAIFMLWLFFDEKQKEEIPFASDIGGGEVETLDETSNVPLYELTERRNNYASRTDLHADPYNLGIQPQPRSITV